MQSQNMDAFSISRIDSQTGPQDTQGMCSLIIPAGRYNIDRSSVNIQATVSFTKINEAGVGQYISVY